MVRFMVIEVFPDGPEDLDPAKPFPRETVNLLELVLDLFMTDTGHLCFVTVEQDDSPQSNFC
jgi:hypothetical protein